MPSDQATHGFLGLGQQAALTIIYEDKALLAVNKPAGQLFHGYTKGLPSPLVDQVKAYIGEQMNKPGEVYLGVVHRLDRPVSGLAIFARNSKAAGRLGEQFQQRSLQKIYLAAVEGNPLEATAVLEDYLLPPVSTDRPSHDQPKFCSLSYTRLTAWDGGALLAIELGTGRRHQIRMQLASRGWPIIGDLEYGAKTLIPGTDVLDLRFRPLALHAARLHLIHPVTQENLRLEATLPNYWSAIHPNIELRPNG